jgi:hypothetical protein
MLGVDEDSWEMRAAASEHAAKSYQFCFSAADAHARDGNTDAGGDHGASTAVAPRSSSMKRRKIARPSSVCVRPC